MRYWLLKSEPSVYSWKNLLAEKKTFWTGVRNAQASHNLRAMKIGDKAFFYHSNEGKEIIGLVRIIGEAIPDSTDPQGKFVMVEVIPDKTFTQPVTLSQIKEDPKLQNMSLVRQARLSVSAVTEDEWKHICKLGGV